MTVQLSPTECVIILAALQAYRLHPHMRGDTALQTLSQRFEEITGFKARKE